MGDDRCHNCDLVTATRADHDAHPDGCQCDRCLSLCWSAWAPRCEHPAVDWQARAIAAERALAESTTESRRPHDPL